MGLISGKRPPRPPMPEELSFQDWLGTQHHLAEQVGKIAFYFAIVWLLVALIKRIPYRIFAKYHFLLALAYLALGLHAFALLQFDYWSQPIGWVMAGLICFGTFSAIWTLLRKTGKSRRVQANVSAFRLDDNILTLTLNAPVWQGHRAGQFLFLIAYGESHPFTIASFPKATSSQLTLMIKELGDYTRNLPKMLQIGDNLLIEGAYGCFDFDDNCDQVWLSAGIGITPFLARLDMLPNTRNHIKLTGFIVIAVYPSRSKLLCRNRRNKLKCSSILSIVHRPV